MKRGFSWLVTMMVGCAMLTPAWAERPELVLQIGHVNDVTKLVWSPDGKIVASGAKDQSVKLWNAQTGALLYSLTTQDGPILAMAFSGDGRAIYAVNQDGVARVWDVPTGALLGASTGPVENLTAAAIVSVGATTLVASASQDQPIVLWSTNRQMTVDGKTIAQLKGHEKRVQALTFAPDGKLLASGSDDGAVKYWDTEDGSLQRTFKSHAMIVNSVAFSADSTALADASDDGSTNIWNLDTGKEAHELQMARPGDGTIAVAFSPDGKTVVTGGQSIKPGEYGMLWDAATEKQTKILVGHERYVTAAAFSPNGKVLATGSKDDTVRFWDAQSGKELRIAGSIQSIPCIAYSPDGALIASGSADGAVRLWNSQTGELRQVLAGHTGSVNAVAFSSDGKTLASGGKDQELRLWDPQSGQKLQTFKGATAPIDTIAWSPDGTQIAAGEGTGSFDGALQIWDAKSGALKQTLNGESLAIVRSVAWSPDGKSIATGSGVQSGGELRIWNALTGEILLKDYGADIHAVRSVAYSSDGKLLVSASGALDSQDTPNQVGDVIKVWNARTRALQQTLTLKNANGWSNAVAILPDNKTLVVGSADNQIRTWNAKTGEALQTVSGHLGQVLSVAAAPDGKTFATAGMDNTIRIWSVATDRQLAALIPLPADGKRKEADNWLAVTPEGYYDASAGAPRYIQWRVGPDLFPVASYEQTLRRPDVLRRALHDEAMTDTASGQKFAKGDSVPPTITFTTPKDGQPVTDNTLMVQMDVTAERKIARIEILANGRPIGAKPLEIGSKPLSVGAKPLSVGSKPLSVGSKPLSVGAKPLSVGAKPLSVGAKPLEVGAKPLEVGAKPLEVGAKPLEVGAKPLEVGAKPIPAGHTILQQFQTKVSLPPGDPNITLTALAYDADNLQAREEIHLTHPTASGATGNLYVLSVGVSKYKNPHFDLKYASSDADTFAGIWKAQQGSQYQKVVITDLTDDQATSTNVRAALFKLVETANEADTVALFFSGHGIQVNDTDYYFATQEIDPLTAASIANTALPWTALQATLASVRAKRILMFLDACHSGNALGGNQASSERMAELLVKRSGVMVFASSRGSEYSYEVDSAQHGAFTEALEEGLGQGKADLDIGGSRDGVITAEELLAYLRARVPQLSNNRQTPSCPLIRDFGDSFPIAKAIK